MGRSAPATHVLSVVLLLLAPRASTALAQTDGAADLAEPTPARPTLGAEPTLAPSALQPDRLRADAPTAQPPGDAADAPSDLPPPYATAPDPYLYGEASPIAPAEGLLVEVPQYVPPAVATGSDPDAARAARRERREARWAPARRSGHRVSLSLTGFGGDIDGAAFAGEWRFRAQRAFFSLLRLGPLAYGVAERDHIGVADASVVAGYETRLVAAGVGVGVTYLRVDERTRRAQGTAAIARLHLRAGALDGVHAQLDLGGTVVDREAVGTHGNLRLRFPLRRERQLDLLFEIMPSASWVQIQVGTTLNLPGLRDSRWRVRPYGGLVEIIDAVGRDGGAAIGFGVQLIYLEAP
ncbi:MAG: hypothetical protein R3B40_10565 [Polyangiales bacterium]